MPALAAGALLSSALAPTDKDTLVADSTQPNGVRWASANAANGYPSLDAQALIAAAVVPSGVVVPAVHGAAQHTDITRSRWLLAEDATLNGGTFATLGASPNQLRVVALADAATQGCFWAFNVPSDWASGVITVQPFWSPGATDAVAHTVRWTLTTKERAAGADVTAAGTAVTFTGASSARTASQLTKDTATSTGVTPAAADNLLMLGIQRIGADAADTYVGVVNLIGILLTYTANQ